MVDHYILHPCHRVPYPAYAHLLALSLPSQFLMTFASLLALTSVLAGFAYEKNVASKVSVTANRLSTNIPKPAKHECYDARKR